ncbi:MAG: putative lipid II flippase FtsW [Oscillospiraceae bacterium]|nr:putative lipid II flippase FtsW [Oscillospiraceae bacterium]
MTAAEFNRRTENRTERGGFHLLQKGKLDITFLTLLCIILVTGLVMLFSASTSYAQSYAPGHNPYYYIVRQFAFALAGLIAMFLISGIDYHIYRKLAWWIYGIAVALLIAVLILPPMKEGFHRWIVLGPINFQPSEIAKFAIIALFAALISINYKRMERFTFGIVLFGVLLAVVCGLVVVETHLSATVLIFAIGVALMIVGGIKLRWVGLAGISGAAMGAVAILTGVVSYGSGRIQNWLNPWNDPADGGFQTIQSLLAIGSGGFLGQGLGKSHQKHLWLPEPQNDFIFAIVCEELGFIGAVIIIVLFALLIWRGFVIAMRAPDKFGSLLVIGITFQVGLQTALNILVVTNSIPNTGISLPFFSYGGTSLLMLLAEMGIILSVSRSSTVMKR